MVRRLILAGLFTLLTAAAGIVVRKLLNQAWHKTVQTPTPSETPERYDSITKAIWAALTTMAAGLAKFFIHGAQKQALHKA
jgi:hypothetical protein